MCKQSTWMYPKCAKMFTYMGEISQGVQSPILMTYIFDASFGKS